MTHLLTKSEYMMYLRHPAWLWLKIHDKTKLPSVSDSTQAIFDAGHNFEKYAEQLFPGGVTLGFTDFNEYSSLPIRTTKALDSGAKTIFQGRFETTDCTFICDVFSSSGNNIVDLCEIKSSTGVKDDHLYDLAFQMVVLERCGYTVGKIGVAHVNNEYVRHGDITPSELVTIADVTEAVKALKDFTLEHIDLALQVTKSSTRPNFSPSLCRLGSFKEWVSIYMTIENIGEGSIYDLCRLTPELISQLEERGIKRIFDIPDDIPLNKFQARQVDAVKTNEVHVEPDMIGAILGEYQYPLYFFDYETFASSIPDFDGLSPYEAMPFQYSLHVIDKPGGDLRHLEYLHVDSSNPAMSICKSLRENIGDTGSVIAWYASFERGRNSKLGELVPEYREFFENLNSRIVDLMDPFVAGFYVHKDFMGSNSIKNVLPVLVPELSYTELDIHEGQSASRLWMDAILYNKPNMNKAKILADLRKYCELDTLAMVRIYEFLRG